MVSVVILTYNGLKLIADNLLSLGRQSYHDFEVVIADNCSQDNSAEFIKNDFPEVKLLEFNKNYGFAEGYNKAIERINSEYIVLLNQDTVADKDFLKELIESAKKDDKIAVCGSKMLFYDYPHTIDNAGGQITIIGSGYGVGFGARDNENFNKFKYVSFVCGGAMLVKKRIFQELGGFDNSYFMYSEDSDLCWRAWLYGYKVAYVPASIIYHRQELKKSPESESSLKIYVNQKNRLASVIKNFEAKNVLLSLIINIWVSAFKLTKLLFALKFKEAGSLVLGYIDLCLGMPNIMNKRRLIQANRKIKDSVLFKIGVIEGVFGSFREYIRWLRR